MLRYTRYDHVLHRLAVTRARHIIVRGRNTSHKKNFPIYLHLSLLTKRSRYTTE